MTERSNQESRTGVSVRRIVAYGAAVFLLSVFQSTVAARFGFLGTAPALLLALTCAAAYFDGEHTGEAVGLASGFLLDALGGSGISVLPLAYTLTGWFIGKMTVRFGHDRIVSPGGRIVWWCVWLGAGVGIGMLITALCLFLTAGKVNIISAFLHIILPEALATYFSGFPLCFVYLLINRRKKA